MAHAAVALDLGQTLDVQSHVTTQITFDEDVVFVDIITDLGLILGRQILDAGIRVNSGTGENFVGSALTDTVNVSQTNFNPLLTRQINTSNTCHKAPP